jgi:uncharacterized membrane protein YdbT with pleckstrin-like domain
MFKIGKKYHLGRKTFWFFFFTRTKSLLFVLLLSLYFTYSIYFGPIRGFFESTLLQKYDYITIGMLTLWFALLSVSLFIILALRSSVLYRQYDFVFNHNALHIQHGIFFKKEHILPYQQIQNVEIHRNFIYALFGLVELDIITGLTEREVGTVKGKKINLFPAIEKQLANKIAHELMRLAAERNGYTPEVNNQTTNQRSRRRRKK